METAFRRIIGDYRQHRLLFRQTYAGEYMKTPQWRHQIHHFPAAAAISRITIGSWQVFVLILLPIDSFIQQKNRSRFISRNTAFFKECVD